MLVDGQMGLVDCCIGLSFEENGHELPIVSTCDSTVYGQSFVCVCVWGGISDDEDEDCAPGLVRILTEEAGGGMIESTGVEDVCCQ